MSIHKRNTDVSDDVFIDKPHGLNMVNYQSISNNYMAKKCLETLSSGHGFMFYVCVQCTFDSLYLFFSFFVLIISQEIEISKKDQASTLKMIKEKIMSTE
jgi:hypothetical protein